MKLDDVSNEQREAGRETLWAKAIFSEISKRKQALVTRALDGLANGEPEEQLRAHAGEARGLDWVMRQMNSQQEEP